MLPATFLNWFCSSRSLRGSGKFMSYFTTSFWSLLLKSDESEYDKSCDTCQKTGKRNQVIKTAPLHPLPPTDEPFEHTLMDCVGPPYLLTIMCQVTRNPAVCLLQSVTTSCVVKVLSHFICIFGEGRTFPLCKC